ncbi:tetratricopeptide-like helical domain-containing protein [Tanacetum coccineum]
MPSSMNISESQNLDTLLESAKPFLREEFEKIDIKLRSLIAILRSAGAGECFHRLGSFLDHLRHVYRIIKLCALFHSVYSNSYSNIVLFDPETGRDEKWRKKIQSLVPSSGVMGNHYKTGEKIPVSRRMLGVFLLMTLADISEQYFGFQDVLYDNSNSPSRMGAVYTLLVREEAIFMQENKKDNGLARDQDIDLVIPPVFDKCTKILDASDQIMARDLYWNVVCEDGCDNAKKEKGEEMLVKCIELNPYVGEPHVLLGQFYLSRGRFDEGESEVEKGLSLLLEWGSAWDKRISWEGWVAWCRVLLNKAKEKDWPQTAWGVINLGHVK